MMTAILTLAVLTASPPAGATAYYDAGSETAGDLPVAACLVAGGFHGVAGDGHEYIYAPAAAIEKCFASLNGELDNRSV